MDALTDQVRGSVPTEDDARDADADALAAPQGVLARLRAALPSLSDGERRVMEVVQADPEGVVRTPVKALAERIGVSEATVVRSCRSLGYSGLRELRLALAAETLPANRFAHPAVAAEDDILTVAEKIVRTDVQAMSDTLAMLDRDTLERAVAALIDARQVIFFAAGGSLPVALEAHYRLTRLGLPSSLEMDAYIQGVVADGMGNGSVAFAISHTGRSSQTHTALLRAKAAGAFCILLTSHSHTPSGNVADLEIISAPADEALPRDAVTSRLTHLVLIEALTVAIALRRPEAARKALLTDQDLIAERRIP